MMMRETTLKILKLVLISRFWVALWAYMGDFVHSIPHVCYVWKGVENLWLRPWTCFDSEMYLRIAQQGYERTLEGFYPLYPLLLRILGGQGETLESLMGVVVSNLAFLGAVLLFFALIRKKYSEKIAWTGIFLLCFYPSSVIFSAVYTESLFLFLSLAAFYFAESKKWYLAGIFGCLAGLTRNFGFLITAAFLIDYWMTHRRNQERFKIGEMIFLFFPLFNFILVQSHAYILTGTLLGCNIGTRFFSLSFWVPIALDFKGLFEADHYVAQSLVFILVFQSVILSNLLVCLFALAGSLLAWKYLPRSYAAYITGMLIMVLFVPFNRLPHTAGFCRYFSVNFPFLLLFSLFFEKIQKNTRVRDLVYFLLLWLNACNSLAFGGKVFIG